MRTPLGKSTSKKWIVNRAIVSQECKIEVSIDEKKQDKFRELPNHNNWDNFDLKCVLNVLSKSVSAFWKVTQLKVREKFVIEKKYLGPCYWLVISLEWWLWKFIKIKTNDTILYFEKKILVKLVSNLILEVSKVRELKLLSIGWKLSKHVYWWQKDSSWFCSFRK